MDQFDPDFDPRLILTCYWCIIYDPRLKFCADHTGDDHFGVGPAGPTQEPIRIKYFLLLFLDSVL